MTVRTGTEATSAAPTKDPSTARSTAVGRFGGTLVLLALLLLAMLASLMVGSRNIAPVEVLQIVFTQAGLADDRAVIWESRVPRTLVGLLAGVALGVAGALIQSITRNPLADPGILGVNAGAGLGVVLGVTFLGLSTVLGYVWFAFAGAIVAAAAVYVIGAAGRRPNPIRITLAGVALGALLTGISSAVTLMNLETFNRMLFWSAGSINSRGYDVALTVAPFIALGVLLAATCTRMLDAISLGDDKASAMGVNPSRARVLSITSVTLLCGAATAAAGPIGFVGLMIPHLSRWLVGPNQAWIFAQTIVAAPALLLFSDVLGRVLVPGELPVGVVVAAIGAPVLIFLARRTRMVEL